MKFDIYNPAFMQDASNMSKSFRIQSIEDGNIISFDGMLLGDIANDIEYSTDAQITWNQLDQDLYITLNKNQYIYFRNRTTSDLTVAPHQLFSTTGKFNLYGDLSALLYPSMAPAEYNYKELFISTLVVDASRMIVFHDEDIPINATAMFYECNELQYPPHIVSSRKSVITSIYQGDENLIMANMVIKGGLCNYAFGGCTSLRGGVTFAVLPKNNGEGMLRYTFDGCTSLEYMNIGEIIDRDSYFLYEGAFRNCINLKRVDGSCRTTYGFWANGAFSKMFSGCINIESVVSVLTKKSVQSYYTFDEMFKGCSRLTTITNLAFSDGSCQFIDMTAGLPDNGIFIKSQDAIWPTGVNGIPDGWTVQDYVEQ